MGNFYVYDKIRNKYTRLCKLQCRFGRWIYENYVPPRQDYGCWMKYYNGRDWIIKRDIVSGEMYLRSGVDPETIYYKRGLFRKYERVEADFKPWVFESLTNI